ncbi:MAG: dihydroorotase family protein [Candidatus Thorarchaeota archaeon]|nr:dihydroorotase family protein [Candidatus Thorarchaeota archaeon]
MSSSLTSKHRKQTERRSIDLVVHNARLLLESGLVRGGIGVSDGVFSVIASDEHLPDADVIIDAGQKILMPGLIDGHAHINDPTMLSHESFKSGSRAAAGGGVTTFIDMPLTNQVDSEEIVTEKIRQGEEDSVVDFSFYGGMINENNYKVIPTLVERGIGAFKAFSCEPYQTNPGVLTRALSEVSEVGGHLTIHSEDQGVLDEFKKDMEGEWDAPVSHSLSRPNLAEFLAIRQNISIASHTGGHLHIAHVTTREGVNEIERGKLRGIMVTTEVCPHHLMFYRDDMNRLGPMSKMNPPLRTREDKAALWSALLRGMIDITVSDHAPCPIEKKEAGLEDIREAWSGVDGTQMILRVLLSEGINKGRLSYSRLLRVSSRNPARIFGLYPKKGVIRVGSDADFVIFDPNREEKLTADMMFSKCGWTLYEGMTMRGSPEMTFVRGVQVFGEGKILTRPGHGRFQAMGSGERPAGE